MNAMSHSYLVFAMNSKFGYLYAESHEARVEEEQDG